jgi:acetaldehyde dehydrogenase/alcohol dehydrogenase
MEIPQPKGSILGSRELELLVALRPSLEDVSFAAGAVIFAQGDEADGFYIVSEGDVRLEVRSEEFEAESVLDYLGPGSYVGEVALLARANHTTTAVAHTDVRAKRCPAANLRRIFDEHPAQGVAILRALAQGAALQLQHAHERLVDGLEDVAADPEVDRMVAAAVAAQEQFASWPEERVDALLEAIAVAVAGAAEELAEMTVAETHIGNPGDKVFKIQFASLGVLGSLQGQIGAGVIADDTERLVTDVAAAVGVIFALVPLTNPVPTFVNKTLICLKSRNALILSCHRNSQGVANRVGEIVEGALREQGAPEGIVQWVKGRTSRRRTAKFMRHEDVGLILATGGPGMVKAAYSAGTPAIGVGAGNAPCWISSRGDVDLAARLVINSKTFDNGLICGAEQHLVVEEAVAERFMTALRRERALVLDEEQTAHFVREAFTPTGDLKLFYTGQTAEAIAGATGLDDAEGATLIVFRADGKKRLAALAHERLAPVLSMFVVSDAEEAVELCGWLLRQAGAGHTAVIHSGDEGEITRFAREMPASRVLVNVAAAQGCSGIMTGLRPSLTLGCGTFGGNSTTDNVSYENVRNVKRVARAVM